MEKILLLAFLLMIKSDCGMGDIKRVPMTREDRIHARLFILERIVCIRGNTVRINEKRIKEDGMNIKYRR